MECYILHLYDRVDTRGFTQRRIGDGQQARGTRSRGKHFCLDRLAVNPGMVYTPLLLGM